MDYILLGLFTAALVGLICGVLIGVALPKWAQPDPEEIDGFPDVLDQHEACAESIERTLYGDVPKPGAPVNSGWVGDDAPPILAFSKFGELAQFTRAEETKGWIFGKKVTLNTEKQTATCDTCGFCVSFMSDVGVMRDHRCDLHLIDEIAKNRPKMAVDVDVKPRDPMRECECGFVYDATKPCSHVCYRTQAKSARADFNNAISDVAKMFKAKGTV